MDKSYNTGEKGKSSLARVHQLFDETLYMTLFERGGEKAKRERPNLHQRPPVALCCSSYLNARGQSEPQRGERVKVSGGGASKEERASITNLNKGEEGLTASSPLKKGEEI